MPVNTPSLYCKKAPPYVTTKTGNVILLCCSIIRKYTSKNGGTNSWSGLFTVDELLPLILVELTFAVAVSSVDADIIVSTIDGLIRQHLVPEKSNVRYV